MTDGAFVAPVEARAELLMAHDPELYGYLVTLGTECGLGVTRDEVREDSLQDEARRSDSAGTHQQAQGALGQG